MLEILWERLYSDVFILFLVLRFKYSLVKIFDESFRFGRGNVCVLDGDCVRRVGIGCNLML